MVTTVRGIGFFGCFVILSRAGVAQLVEYELPKLGVAGSNPVARSNNIIPCYSYSSPAEPELA